MTGKPEGNPGAPPAEVRGWKTTEWSRLQANVFRLQVRIAKAVEAKRWGKVKALQRILVTSWSARMLAVKTVTTNKGKNTPGIDGVIWKTAQAKLQAVETLRRRGYRAQPLRRVYIPKTNGKLRPLGIPTIQDRAFQALYAMALSPIAETQADPHSYGFRPRRAVADAIMQCQIALASDNRARWILEGDIKACFDRIDHQWMLDHIPMDKVVLRKWLNAGVLEDGNFHHTREGTPQGGIASPILANMVLDGLQATVTKAAPTGSKVNFVRYADDFICTGINSTVLRDYIKPAIVSFLAERGLILSEEKTLITEIENGFDFLGFNIRKYNRKLLIKPTKAKVHNFLSRLKDVCKQVRFRPLHQVILSLNRKLKGWANFYRFVCSSRIFSAIDHHLFRLMWYQLCRRHPCKSKRWVRKRYFRSLDFRHWVLFGRKKRKDHYKEYRLLTMASVSIRRHVKFRMKANPFHPDFQAYLKRRAAIQMAERARERSKAQNTTTPWRKMGNLLSDPKGS